MSLFWRNTNASKNTINDDKTSTSKEKQYTHPIDKALDHFENSPKDLDMEDMFWLDELMGDD